MEHCIDVGGHIFRQDADGKLWVRPYGDKQVERQIDMSQPIVAQRRLLRLAVLPTPLSVGITVPEALWLASWSGMEIRVQATGESYAVGIHEEIFASGLTE